MPTTGGQTLTVGAGKAFATLAAAAAASHDGDVIAVDAGTYTNDFATITTKISIVGVGGMVHLVATAPPPNRKAILTVDQDATIRNLTFSGAAIAESDGGNGAGIRYEGGRLVLQNCAFSDNQNGLLGAPVLAALTVNTIALDHCSFSGNGSGSGYTHNLYIGAVDSLLATNSIFEHADVGHEFKSRAFVNTIAGNIFRDGDATASYDIDLPNGGVDSVTGNLIEKGLYAQNNAMIHFGGEGIPYAGSALSISGNSFVADHPDAVAVLNQTAIGVDITANSFTAIAPAQILRGPGSETGNTDGAGGALADSTLVGVLPGNTLVITDDAPHSVVLTGTLQAVQGGAGELTVRAEIGHVVVIGGRGGLDYSERAGTGGSSIATAAGSLNRVTLLGQDLLDSEGQDTIVTGDGNVTGRIGGIGTVSEGSGDNQWSVLGTAVITGHGAHPVVSVGPHGDVTIGGALGYLAVSNNGGAARFDIVQGGTREVLSIQGGAVEARVFDGRTNVTTAAGATGTVLTLGAGDAQVVSAGRDEIYAGSGSATVIVSGSASIYAGSGALAVFGRGPSGARVYGHGGRVVLDGDSGQITYLGGTRASTVDLRLSNNTLIGGSGRLTINGGARETLIGGSGGMFYTAGSQDGANTITTAPGARNVLLLAGADTVDSWGQDTIDGGFGNQTLTVHGEATITGSTGTSHVTLSGHDMLRGRGQDFVTVTAGASVSLVAGSLASVVETAASVSLLAGSGGRVVVTGGAATLTGSAGGSVCVTTTAGVSTDVALHGGGASVLAQGTDTLHTGSGTDTITITGAHTRLWAGGGALTVHDTDPTAGDQVTVQGSSGSLRYDQGGAALRFLGGSGTAVIDGGWGSLDVTGGSGSLAISGGTQGMRFLAGSGIATVAMTAGGGELTFGSGQTDVQVAGGVALFACVAGRGGGLDSITGFRGGTDRLSLQGGVTVATRQDLAGMTRLVLSDGTQVNLVGLLNPAHLFG